MHGARAEAPLLRVTDLRAHFPVRRGFLRRVSGWVRAVDGVSLDITRGETLGLVGESGCGKTTLGRCVLGLLPPTSGGIAFDGEDVSGLSGEARRRHKRRVQCVFQDPYSSLNPRMTVFGIVSEPLAVHRACAPRERRERVAGLLSQVGLRPDVMSRYPHEFSGGQRQRIGIARALALRPELIVCDEPVSALDVSVQAQVLNLLDDLRERFGLSYLFIAHDLSVVEHVCDRIAVMYLGRIVEVARDVVLCSQPVHPYTRALVSAIPMPDPRARADRTRLSGEVPSPLDPPPGCPFHPRCPVAEPGCRSEVPALREIAPGHFAACRLL